VKENKKFFLLFSVNFISAGLGVTKSAAKNVCNLYTGCFNVPSMDGLLALAGRILFKNAVLASFPVPDCP
jgi:hypothetical protein